MDIDLKTGDLKLYPVKPRIILLQNFKWTRNEVSIVFSFGFFGVKVVPIIAIFLNITLLE